MNHPLTPIPSRPDRTNWRERAACIGHDPEMFFADDKQTIAAAKAICAGCPARLLCHEDAETNRDYGVRGGIDRTPRVKRPPKRRGRIATGRRPPAETIAAAEQAVARGMGVAALAADLSIHATSLETILGRHGRWDLVVRLRAHGCGAGDAEHAARRAALAAALA